MYEITASNHHEDGYTEGFGTLETDHGFINFNVQGMPHNCGIALVHGVKFSPLYDHRTSNQVYGKRKKALMRAFNEFLTTSYKGAGSEWTGDPYKYPDNPFAAVLNRSMVMCTDAEFGEYGTDKKSASLWNMCTDSDKWVATKTTMNPNSENKIGVFLHIRDANDVSSN